MASGETLVVWTPKSNSPPASNYAQLVVVNARAMLAFDTTTAEAAVFETDLPRNYAATTGITAYVTWAADTATTGTIGWSVEFETLSGQALGSDGFASAQTITAATVPGTARTESITSVAVTAANADAVAGGVPCRVRLKRDVANDTAAGDALFIALELKET